jgi:phage terminase small subunit|tara:strand:+ start:4741 stop:4959 length:219 start_codon:yes stop_codon:yes gene_type:complete
MTKVLMTEGPMAGRVIDILDLHEAVQVVDKGMGVLHVEEAEKPKPPKSTRAKRVRQKRKTERAVAPVETPEG